MNELKGPIGLDIGTANIVAACADDRERGPRTESNAFFTIPSLPTTLNILQKKGLMFFEKDDQIYVLGNSADNFANILGGTTRRPMKKGLVDLKESEGVQVIQAILDNFFEIPPKKGEKLFFSVPGEPMEHPESVFFNESIFKKHLTSLGYSPEPINEGLAVVLSELSDNDATGIGVSMGGGMCNICFSYLSIPAVTYSIQRGGDYIDAMVAESVGETPSKIKDIKETELDLSVEPGNNTEICLHLYYDKLFSMLVNSLQQVFRSSENIPRLHESVPLVLSGGVVLPRGSKEKFENAFAEIQLPIGISEITVASRPLYSTARGALLMAEAKEEMQ
ncbi:MAG: hypothetical protein GY859_26345 [Desulfobacterales bacterium]|nr:hypothetical protein [Desulfobacterales bacterium]